MGVVASPVVRRIIQVASGPDSQEALLASVGLAPGVDATAAMREGIESEAYYGLIERAAAPDDDELPFRYAEALQPEDFAALGLALKTAPNVGDALTRLSRYILVLTDTLEYELVDAEPGRLFVLRGRPNHRRGARIANECALAAVTSMMRRVAGAPLAPERVTFRHPAPPTTGAYRAFFGCPVEFDARLDAVHFGDAALATPSRLGDEGLSAYLLAQLDALREERPDASLATRVQGAVIDALPDGLPRTERIARRLGMSERTLHRRLTEDGHSFKALADGARRDAAEALLVGGDHSLAEVAFLTGFSEQSSFQRAFKRWTGKTPAEFRRGARSRD